MNATQEFFDLMNSYLSKSDIYEAQTIGRIVAELVRYRTENNLSQKELAKELGVTQGMVSRWESGDYNFTIKKVCQLCEKLGLTMELKMQKESEMEMAEESAAFDTFPHEGGKEMNITH